MAAHRLARVRRARRSDRASLLLREVPSGSFRSGRPAQAARTLLPRPGFGVGVRAFQLEVLLQPRRSRLLALSEDGEGLAGGRATAQLRLHRSSPGVRLVRRDPAEGGAVRLVGRSALELAGAPLPRREQAPRPHDRGVFSRPQPHRSAGLACAVPLSGLLRPHTWRPSGERQGLSARGESQGIRTRPARSSSVHWTAWRWARNRRLDSRRRCG